MTVCKVLFYGLKACDIIGTTKDIDSETNSQRSHSLTSMEEKSTSINRDFLNVDIKPLTTPTGSERSSTSNDNHHESSPIHVKIHETSRGRHRICISQTLLRTHTGDV